MMPVMFIGIVSLFLKPPFAEAAVNAFVYRDPWLIPPCYSSVYFFNRGSPSQTLVIIWIWDIPRRLLSEFRPYWGSLSALLCFTELPLLAETEGRNERSRERGSDEKKEGRSQGSDEKSSPESEELEKPSGIEDKTPEAPRQEQGELDADEKNVTTTTKPELAAFPNLLLNADKSELFMKTSPVSELSQETGRAFIIGSDFHSNQLSVEIPRCLKRISY